MRLRCSALKTVFFFMIGLVPLLARTSPGFFPAEQNRKILTKERVDSIMNHTPMNRFGDPQELVGATIWLASEKASSFVTGAVIRVDGGFTAMTI